MKSTRINTRKDNNQFLTHCFCIRILNWRQVEHHNDKTETQSDEAVQNANISDSCCTLKVHIFIHLPEIFS